MPGRLTARAVAALAAAAAFALPLAVMGLAGAAREDTLRPNPVKRLSFALGGAATLPAAPA